MTSASNALHLTQGAVSQQVSRLESFLDQTLFVRDRRGLRLTAGGERLLGRARALLRVNDEIRAEMGTDELSGGLRLGVPFDLVGTVLPPAIKSFALAHPEVELSLRCDSSSSLITAVDDGSVDLAVIEVATDPDPGHLLAIERLVWVGARGGCAHRVRPLPVSLVSETCAFRPMVLTALRTAGDSWRMLFDDGTLEATLAMVRMDLAVTVSLASCVPVDLDVLDRVSGLPELPFMGIDLRFPPSPPSRAVIELARRIEMTLTGVPPRSLGD